MRIAYLITCIILWILICLQIPAIIRFNSLLKRMKKDIEEIDDLQQECEKAYKEMLEEKQMYKQAKEELVAKYLPDFEDAAFESASDDGDPVFHYIHENARHIIHAERCDLEWLSAEVGYLVHKLYCGLHSKDPDAADSFKEYVSWIISGEDSPTWNANEDDDENIFIVTRDQNQEKNQEDVANEE